MAQQIQFIYLSQSDYDNINPKSPGLIYFTSDTHRIYKGDDLYAATTFDQLNFSSIDASSITVDGSAVSLVGHSHSMSDIDGLQSAITAATSGFASASHTHAISDVTNLSSILTGITSSSLEKDTVTADVGYFGEINVSGSANLTVNNISASAISVNGIGVALQGHGHSAADISGLETALSTYASSGHTHVELQGITSNAITKETGTFTNLSVTNASFVATNVEADSVIAVNVSTSNLFVTNASFVATSVEATSVIAASVNASTATFGDINVTGTATLSVTNVSAATLTAGAGTFAALLVGGNAVASVGHTHSQYAASNHTHSTYASIGHTHAISDVTNLSSILNGINSASISKTTGTFTNLVVTNASFVATSVEADGVVAASVVASTVTADIGNFKLLSVSGSANFSVNNVSANSVTVNGSQVALVGHTHSVADVSGLSTVLSAYASASHSHAISDITNLQTTLNGFASSGHTHAQYAASDHNHNGVYASATHSHAISEITNLQSTLNGLASSGHTHAELAGITSNSISKTNGDFSVLTASAATFGSLTISGSSMTLDVADLVASAISVASLSVDDLDIGGTLTVSGMSISSMTVTDLSVTGTIALNNKVLATQEYVLAQISAAIGQVLASAY